MRLAPAIALAFAVACAPAQTTKGALRAVKDTAAVEAAHQGRRFALVIGVDRYEDAGWRGLRYPAKDARDLAAALADPKRGRFDSVQVLTTPQETTREAILAAFARLAEAADRPEDVAVVYVSGHGTLARDNRGELRRYLVTSDARYREVAKTALPVELVKERLDSLGSRRRLLILASCHSGGGKSLLPDEITAELAGIKSGFFVRPIEHTSRISMVLSASDWNETAREDEGLQNDIYTHYFVEALDGRADRNLDGAVSATEAHDHARRKTFAFTGGQQRPSAEILEAGADPVLLAGGLSREGTPELFSYDPRLDGFELRVDGENLAELPGGVAVAAGRRKVQLAKGGEALFDQELELRVGERLNLETLLARSRPRSSVVAGGALFGFIDAASRAQVLPAVAGIGTSARFEDLLLPRLGLWADVSAAFGRGTLTIDQRPIPFAFATAVVGAAAPLGWHFGDKVSLYTGPRVAAFWIQRSFNLESYQSTQSYLTAAPGWMGAAVWAPLPRLELSLQTQLSLTYVVVDGQGGARGFAGVIAGGGYRF